MTQSKLLTLRSSSALATATTEYGVFEVAKKTSTCTATSANKLVDSTGLFTTTDNIVVGDVIKNTTTGKFALVTAVDSATQLSVGADIFSNTNAYAIYPGTGKKIQEIYEQLNVMLDVTAAGTDVGDTLDVYIDTSFDGGTSFINIGHYTQVLGNGGAKKFLLSFKAAPIAATNVLDFSGNQNAGNTTQIGFGDRLRYRAVMVDADADGSFTFSIKAFLK